MSANIRPAGVFDTTYAQDIALNRTRTDKLLSYGAFFALLLIPLLTAAGPLGLNIVPQAYIGIINRIAIFAVAVIGLNILVGYTGQISLGHAAFMAVGAYSAALIARGFTVGDLAFPALPFWLALPLAALVTGLVGLFFGLPSLRVKGFYLAMATLAAQFIIPWTLQNPLAQWTNGANPLPVPIPTLGPLVFNGSAEMFYVILPVAVFAALAARNITRTRVGRAFVSVRDNDLAAELLGINVFAYKLQAFFLSALFAGLAGALLAFEDNTISVAIFDLNNSILMLGMLIVGGAGFPLGPLFGVAFFKLMETVIIPFIKETLLRQETLESIARVLPFLDAVKISSSLDPILFGLFLIVFVILEPRGLAHRWEILKISWKIRPYSH
ncbi:MAG: branched-chain amino acid ABC transporter permease [Chloroflexi bacterium]|nr:branched-chain amino acid ABC transporter permease [Chloroflexota bacterium]